MHMLQSLFYVCLWSLWGSISASNAELDLNNVYKFSSHRAEKNITTTLPKKIINADLRK